MRCSIADIAAGNAFVLEQSGEIAGFYSLEPISTDTVELGHLFVQPEAIGAGHGRALLTHACEAARERGYATLLIQGDPNAEAFYRAAGAQNVGSRKSASIPGRELPLLEISLAPPDSTPRGQRE